jgi:type IV pilus assembly protein PilA
MLIKMRESKGFTLVELMIVVAIIGILAAVAVPFYQRYVMKSRLTSLIFPGMHSMETLVGTYYSTQNDLPGSVDPAVSLSVDADTRYMTNVGWVRNSGSTGVLTITIDTSRTAFRTLTTPTITATANSVSGGKLSWVLSGTLVNDLGIQ